MTAFLPGMGGGGGVDLPPPTPPPPKTEDPEIAEAKRRQRQADLQRRGRRATILAGELESSASIARPEATGAQLLG